MYATEIIHTLKKHTYTRSKLKITPILTAAPQCMYATRQLSPRESTTCGDCDLGSDTYGT